MIRHVPAAAAQVLSQVLWALSRTPQVRLENEATWRLFRHATDTHGDLWLVALDGYEINIHFSAASGEIEEILQPFVDVGELADDTNTQQAALAASKRGLRLVVHEAFPQFFKDRSKTYEEMIATGLPAAPEVLP